MNDVAIRVKNLSKQYRIGGPQVPYKTIRESLIEAGRAPFRRMRKLLCGHAYGAAEMDATIWALKDVSFEVKRGEVVGIIGRNGAGKTTLLKILSRITEPTEGYAEVHGRVGSLLEVGTGFHPELTGRENIYLNGAILGMKRAEIERKFDEIVDFAEIERFLDTPVKHYSSGMYVRLAFAVAAHLEPDILLVDEVLAVGDAEFQKKCLGKMKEVTKEGRTVLFVSHNLSAVQRLCESSFVLDQGHLIFQGIAQAGVARYIDIVRSRRGNAILFKESKVDTGLRFVSCYVAEEPGKPVNYLRYTVGGHLVIEYEVSRILHGAQVTFELWHSEYGCVLSSTSLDRGVRTSTLSPGIYRSELTIPPFLIRPGAYWVTLSASVPGIQMFDEIEQACQFDVTDDGSPIALLSQGRRGIILPVLEWQITCVDSGA